MNDSDDQLTDTGAEPVGLDPGAPEVEVIPAGSPEAKALAGELDDGLDPDADELEDLEVLAGIPREATNLDLWRRHPRTGKFEFIDNLALDDFSLSLIAERFGGGKYQSRPKRMNGKLLKGARTFTIAGPPKAARPAPIEQPEPGGELATVTELLREVAMELRARNESPRGSDNPLQLAMQMATAMREASQQAVELALASRDDSGRLDPFELMERVFDMQERMGGGGGSGTDGVVKDLGREILTMLRANKGAVRRQEEPGAPATAGASRTDTQGAPPLDRPAWVGVLGPWIPQLLALAAGGKDPVLYASVIQDQLPEESLRMLAYVVSGTGFADSFYLQFPDARAHRAWFDELIAVLREDLGGEPDVQETEEVPAEAGDVPEDAAGVGAPEPDGA